MLGPDQPVILHLLDIPPAQASLEGVKMEIIDAAFPLVQGKLVCCGFPDDWITVPRRCSSGPRQCRCKLRLHTALVGQCYGAWPASISAAVVANRQSAADNCVSASL